MLADLRRRCDDTRRARETGRGSGPVITLALQSIRSIPGCWGAVEIGKFNILNECCSCSGPTSRWVTPQKAQIALKKRSNNMEIGCGVTG